MPTFAAPRILPTVFAFTRRLAHRRFDGCSDSVFSSSIPTLRLHFRPQAMHIRTALTTLALCALLHAQAPTIGPAPGWTGPVERNSTEYASIQKSIELLEDVAQDASVGMETQVNAAYAAVVMRAKLEAGRIYNIRGRFVAAATRPDGMTTNGRTYYWPNPTPNLVALNVKFKDGSGAGVLGGAGKLLHEAIHCGQFDPNPDDKKQKARTEFEAYCAELLFWERIESRFGPNSGASDAEKGGWKVLEAGARKQKADNNAKRC